MAKTVNHIPEDIQPNSQKTPPRAADCHLHIVDGRFPLVAKAAAPPDATLADYRLLQKRLGTEKAVIVQAKCFGTDNSCILSAIEELGKEKARGVAVVHPDTSKAELCDLDKRGVTGIRFSVWNHHDAVTSIDMIEPLAKRIADFGWHVQLLMLGGQIAANAPMLDRLPCPLVFDHMCRLPLESGVNHPSFKIVCHLLEKGNTWIKLSAAYQNRLIGAPSYADAGIIAKAFAAIAPERVVWGSDWPHVTEKIKPDGAFLLKLLEEWFNDENMLKKILADNPAALYKWPV
ncbi:MAG: amidohydrolase family protein [Acidaminococcales bacterium]|jgi:predicted TIM-barrel fold metal-dependent hydrolase|nr:amidohydrolase family protein [Acidaminococcales bacterium]